VDHQLRENPLLWKMLRVDGGRGEALQPHRAPLPGEEQQGLQGDGEAGPWNRLAQSAGRGGRRGPSRGLGPRETRLGGGQSPDIAGRKHPPRRRGHWGDGLSSSRTGRTVACLPLPPRVCAGALRFRPRRPSRETGGVVTSGHAELIEPATWPTHVRARTATVQ